MSLYYKSEENDPDEWWCKILSLTVFLFALKKKEVRAVKNCSSSESESSDSWLLYPLLVELPQVISKDMFRGETGKPPCDEST